MDFLEILFTNDTAVIEANKAEAARIAAVEAAEKVEKEARRVEMNRLRCPKCAGEGRLSQFMHRNGGECFLCGGTGVFSGYRAI